LDSLTHIAIGACLGEAFEGRRLGKKSMVWGILAHSLPDIDFISSTWLSTVDHLLAHRGLTHSLTFVLIATLLLTFLADRIHKTKSIPIFSWIVFFATCLTAHILLDMFNAYGIGLLEPFNQERFSLSIIYVADPFFSISVGIALLGLLFLNNQHKARRYCWMVGLSISLLYLTYCVSNKISIERKMRLALSEQHLDFKRMYITPAPLQNWLWFIIAETESGYFIKYVSVFDSQIPVFENFFPQNNSLSRQLKDQTEFDKLVRFSEHFYTLEQRADTIIFNDLRFGQIVGWYNPKEAFVFHYYLQPTIDNTLVVQRGRFAEWNRETFDAYLERIKGN
jgi:inner membrane protein